MKFGSIIGNGYRTRASICALMAADIHTLDEFLDSIQSARATGFKRLLVRISPNVYHCGPDTDDIDSVESLVHLYAGCGIDIAAGLQQSTGSNQNESV